MRLKGHIGALAGVVWLASSAVLPRLDDISSTCSSTDAVEATAVIPTSTCSSTALEPTTTPLIQSNCTSSAAEQATESVTLSSPIPKVVTVTVTPNSGSSSFSTVSAPPGFIPGNSSSLGSPSGQVGSGSSSCTSSETAGSASQGPTSASARHTVTLTRFTAFSTSTIAVSTSTLSVPVLSATALESVVTVTISGDSATVGGAATITAPPVSEPTVAATIPIPVRSDATSVLTFTYPDGIGHTTTVLVTITIPGISLTSALWSTVVTPTAIPVLSGGEDVTVTVFATSTCSLPLSQATGGLQSSLTSNTVAAPSSSASASPASQRSEPYRPYALTYTLSPNGVLTTPFTGTITITPSSPLFAKATRPSVPADPQQLSTVTETLESTLTVTQLAPTVSVTPIITVVTPHPISNSLGSVPIIGLTETITIWPSGFTPSTTVPTVTQLAPAATGTPIITVATPHPISNSLGSVPIIGLTETITIWPSDTETSGTTSTTSPAAPPAGGRNQASPAFSSDARSDLVTVTVTALDSTDTSTAHDDAQTVTVTAALSGAFSSLDGASPYGLGTSTQQRTVTVPLLSVTSTASNLPNQQTQITLSTILTTSISEASGYGSSPASTQSGDSPVVVTVTQSLVTSTPTPSSPIPPTPLHSETLTGSVVLVTYTVPGHSGVGGSSYTVTYTMLPSVSTSSGEGNGPSTTTFHSPSQTTALPSPATSSSATISSSASRTPFTVTVTPPDASGTPITITWTPSQPNLSGSGTITATPTFVSSAEPVSATPEASGYGGGQGSESEVNSVNPLRSTLATSSGLPALTTASNAAGFTTSSAAQPTTVTVTEHASTPSGEIPDSTVLTAPHSVSSPAVATLSSNTGLATVSGGYQFDTTDQPTVVTVTEHASTSAASARVSTIVVSVVTLSQTVGIGYGSSTVVEFTTEVPVLPGPSSSTAPASTVLVTSLTPTWTSSDLFPPLSTSIVLGTSGTALLSLSSDLPSVGGNGTVTGSIQPPVVITVWPTATSSIPVVTTQTGSSTDMDSPWLSTSCSSTLDLGPTSVRPPLSSSQGGSIVQSVDATAADNSTSVPPEMTIWPSPVVNSSCSTLPTSHSSSVEPVGFTTITTPLFSLTTLSPALTSTALSGVQESSSCTETVSGASSIVTPDILSAASESEESADLGPQPQTDFHHPAHAVTDNSIVAATTTFGGYVFSGSANGSGSPASTNLVTETDTNLPLSQPTPALSSPHAYGAASFVTTESADPNAISASSSSTVVGSDATIVTLPTIVSTSLTAPGPVLSSFGPPTDLSTIEVSLSPSPILTTALSSTTAAGLPITSFDSKSPEWMNLTTLISTNSQGLASTTTALANITATLTSSQHPSLVSTSHRPSLISSKTRASSKTTSSTTADVNISSGASPVVLTLTVTTTVASEFSTVTISATGPATAPGNSSSAAAPTSLATLPSSATANATSLVAPSNSVTSSAAVLSTASVVVSPTVIPSVPTVFPNSGTATATGAPAVPLNNTSITPTPLANSTAGALTSSVVLTSLALTGRTTVATVFLNSTTGPLPPVVASTGFLGTSSQAVISGASSTLTSVTLSSAAFDTRTVSAKATPVPRALPGACGAEGDRGDVVLKFDEIQRLAATEAELIAHDQPNAFEYHRFLFSRGFHAALPQSAKYKPSSGSQMLQHDSSTAAQVGLKQLRDNVCFRFDFRGVSLGCDSADASCVFHVTGLQWNGVEDVVQGDATFEIAACPASSDCTLSHQVLEPAVARSFSNLTSINITMSTSSATQTWWADDLQLAWTDNDCSVAACRALVPDTVMAPRPHGSLSRNAKRFLRWAIRG